AAPAPALKAQVNTQVQISTQPSPFDVREAFQSFLRQTQMRQWSEAQRAADQIAAALGSGHVMALRAQAYLALQQDDLPRARSQYLQLQQALPEDREAGLNLALIEWRSGDRDAAANRLVGLVQRFPNDPQIQALSQNVRAQ
ncbi:MAG: tetratricopeptide repeat protein, partial [Ramlibacter sp.]|nr:tetratricopeptide repeat protein [Ramlibacter sp.]